MAKTKRLYSFNVSYSAIGLEESCARNFYYCHIAGVIGEDGIQAYGNAGNVVHSVLEHNYYKPIDETSDLFKELWESKKLHTSNRGFFGRMLNADLFWNSILNARARKYKFIEMEEKYQFQDAHLIKGFVDGKAKAEAHHFTPTELEFLAKHPDLYEDIITVDWKTNSQMDEGHVGQMQMYAYLHYRKYKKLPKKYIWEYIKIGKKLERIMTMDDVYHIRDEIDAFLQRVYSRETFADWKPSPDGARTNCSEGACAFCNHKARCKDDMVPKDEENFKLVIKKGKIYFENPTTSLFDKILDKYFSYVISADPRELAIILRAVKKKSGRDWDGVKHMKKYGAFPLGLLNKIKYYIAQYADATGKHCSIEIDDQRTKFDEPVELMPKLKGIDLRYYQSDAKDAIFRNKLGLIAVPTAGGKTVIAAEVYRSRPNPFLFVVDRKVLLTQTVTEFEEVLDMKDQVGTIEAGVMNVKGNLTVATIQTINARFRVDKINPKDKLSPEELEKLKVKIVLQKARKKEMMDYLKTIEIIISDEAHIAKSAQYDTLYKHAINTHIRIGLTGTPADDAQNALELHKNIGYVIYRIPVQTLIEEGTLMKPEINFMKYDPGFIMKGDFNDYREQLIENKNRNKLLIDTVESHKGKVQLILIDRISHGKDLQAMLEERGMETFFIHGAVSDKQREAILADARNKHPRVLIGTSSIVSKGLNLKPLQIIVNATGNATSIMTIQSLGRVLRTDKGKTVAIFYDFYDDIDYFMAHTEERIKAFEKEDYTINIVDMILEEKVKVQT